MNSYSQQKISKAIFEEAVAITLFEILEDRVDLDEYFTRKDGEEE